jgi:DNA-binding beta-propeller fold protein YncE
MATARRFSLRMSWGADWRAVNWMPEGLPMKSLSLIVLLASAALAAAPEPYHAIGRIQIGGEGGWDYVTVDSAARRLYVSHGTRVVVVDLDTEKVVGEIPDTPGVHGIAIAPKLDRGFISNGRSNNVTIFDLKTLKMVGQVATGQNPDAIFYDSVSNRVFTFNGRSKDATVIDAQAATVAGVIPLGGKPEFAVGDGKGKVYVNIEDTGEIAEIDTARLVVTRRYPLTGCEEPSGLAIDVAHRRLFSVCGNKVMAVSDPDTGKVIALLPIGQGADGAGFDAGRGLAFSSNGDGTLTVVGEVSGKYEVIQNTETQPSARTMTVDPATHRIYLPAARFGPAPAATTQQPRSRPPMVPDSFTVIIVGN